jgi:hypothetical protein
VLGVPQTHTKKAQKESWSMYLCEGGMKRFFVNATNKEEKRKAVFAKPSILLLVEYRIVNFEKG